MQDYKQGRYREIDGSALDEATQQGWRLVHVLYAMIVEGISQSGPHPNPGVQPNGYYNSDTISTTVPVPVQKVRYLVWLDETSARFSAHAENKALVASLAACRAANEEGKAALASATGKVDALTLDVAQLRERLAANERADNIRRERVGKMEEHLAAVREAVGSKVFDAIPAPATK